MSIKHHLIRIGRLTLLCTWCVCVLLLGVYVLLPYYVESRLLPKIATEAGLDEVSLTVRRIGLSGADLSDLRIASGHKHALSVQSIQIDYSLAGLLRRHIERAVISGFEATCEFTRDGITIDGLDLHKIGSQFETADHRPPATSPANLPVVVDRLEVRNAVAILNWDNTSLLVPFELSARPAEESSNRMHCLLRVYPRNQALVVSAQLDLKARQLTVDLDAAGIELARFTDLASRYPQVNLSATAALEANAVLNWAPFKIVSATGRVTLDHANIVYDNMRLANAARPDGQSLPFLLEIDGRIGQDWIIKGSAMQWGYKVPLVISDLSCRIKTSPQSLEGTGTVTIALGSTDPDRAFFLTAKDPVAIHTQFSVKAMLDGNWEFDFRKHISEQDTKKTWHFQSAGMDTRARLDEFRISGSGKHMAGLAKYALKFSQIGSDIHDMAAKVRDLKATGTVSTVETATDTRLKADLKLTATGAHLSSNTADVTLPEISLIGEASIVPNEMPHFDAVLNVASGRFKQADAMAAASGISASIPLKWPWQKTVKTGRIALKSVTLKESPIGSLNASVRQTQSGAVFDGIYVCSILGDRDIPFSGSLNPGGEAGYHADVQFSLPQSFKTTAIDVKRILPEVKNLSLRGHLGLNGSCQASRDEMNCPLDMLLEKARLELQDNKIDVHGLRFEFNTDNILSMGSRPAQSLSFEKASWGALAFTDGKIRYQMESAHSFLIETLQFKWCDGTVTAQAFRISPGVSVYDLTLYCDRLNLASMLEAFGVAKAQGRGSLNGRIPVKYADGRISFDDAFLFSTPGDGGTIRISGGQFLTAGMPTGTPQYTQIELAREALKDYEYKWAKLNLKTEGDNLLLKMQFDGKPLNPLPFVYKQDVGGFVRVETGTKGSTFQGISLDVNFKLPLNQILRYKDLFDMIQGDKE